MRSRDSAVADFTAWYEQIHPRLVMAVRMVSRDAELARDVVDEACCRAFERWPRVAAMDSPDGWVYVVALHELRRRARRRGRERALFCQEHEGRAGEAPVSEFEDLIAPLSDRQRRAVVLRHVADLPEAEIARAMGVSRSTVSSTLRDAYRLIRRRLDDSMQKVPNE